MLAEKLGERNLFNRCARSLARRLGLSPVPLSLSECLLCWFTDWLVLQGLEKGWREAKPNASLLAAAIQLLKNSRGLQCSWFSYCPSAATQFTVFHKTISMKRARPSNFPLHWWSLSGASRWVHKTIMKVLWNSPEFWPAQYSHKNSFSCEYDSCKYLWNHR